MSDIALAIKPQLPAIRERIANGEYASHIAQELGISPQILSFHLRKLPDWDEILQSAHESRLDAESDALRNAVESRDFELARAREGQLKRIEWRAERECPQRWGAKQEITHHQAAPVLNISVVSAPQIQPEKVIEHSQPDPENV